MGPRRKFGQYLAFPAPETGLAFDLEYQGYTYACDALDFVIGVNESLAQAARQKLTHGRFACAHKTDQEDVSGARVLRHPGGTVTHAAILAESP
jgi:hypothetical protein